MLSNAYLLAKFRFDTAENERHFAENLPKTDNYPTDHRPSASRNSTRTCCSPSHPLAIHNEERKRMPFFGKLFQHFATESLQNFKAFSEISWKDGHLAGFRNKPFAGSISPEGAHLRRALPGGRARRPGAPAAGRSAGRRHDGRSAKFRQSVARFRLYRHRFLQENTC